MAILYLERFFKKLKKKLKKKERKRTVEFSKYGSNELQSLNNIVIKSQVL